MFVFVFVFVPYRLESTSVLSQPGFWRCRRPWKTCGRKERERQNNSNRRQLVISVLQRRQLVLVTIRERSPSFVQCNLWERNHQTSTPSGPLHWPLDDTEVVRRPSSRSYSSRFRSHICTLRFALSLASTAPSRTCQHFSWRLYHALQNTTTIMSHGTPALRSSIRRHTCPVRGAE